MRTFLICASAYALACVLSYGYTIAVQLNHIPWYLWPVIPILFAVILGLDIVMGYGYFDDVHADESFGFWAAYLTAVLLLPAVMLLAAKLLAAPGMGDGLGYPAWVCYHYRFAPSLILLAAGFAALLAAIAKSHWRDYQYHKKLQTATPVN